MPSKTVLSVGQCRPDHAAISAFLNSNFDVRLVATDVLDDTLETLAGESVDLILINRKLDADYSEGMDVLRSVKASPQYASIPAMIVSNFADAQEKAVEAGAVYGFGKSELNSETTVERVQKALSPA